ncbi:MAG TPA: DNA topoisomerase I, partial [Alphaproteobacteria bacterium]|nr:DNA topoisomerase I [Alphaproteobacteria bacterium]
YSEASLVKKLEELGIGRPSTYASILSVLQERNYVRLEKRRFIPEDRGRIVTAFMENFFNKYVQYDFTADLENALDDVSADKLDWKALLRGFWAQFDATVKNVEPLTITDVLNRLEESLSEHLFPNPADRVCPECGATKGGKLSLKIGKFGAFIGCSNYPECRYTRPFGGQATEEKSSDEPDLRELGTHDGENVVLRKGPYGWYVQQGKDAPKAAKGEKKEKSTAKRTSLPRNMNPADVTLEQAVALLALPRTLGVNPDNGQEIQAGVGRFGPYLKIGSTFKSLTAADNVLTIDLPRALELLANVKEKTPPQEIGAHPADGKPVTIGSGRFGPYIKHGSVIASVPKAIRDENRLPTMDEAVALLAAKAEKQPKAAAKKTAVKKTTAAKKAATAKKTTAAKKTAAKKTTGKTAKAKKE